MGVDLVIMTVRAPSVDEIERVNRLLAASEFNGDHFTRGIWPKPGDPYYLHSSLRAFEGERDRYGTY